MVELKPENEVLTKRTYSQKVYASGTTNRYIAHAGHIHYKDEDGNFQDIDTTLEFSNGSFGHKRASFEAKLPRFSDQKFDFRNRFEGIDHTISMIPQCAHVEGVAINSNDGNYVLYENAFGTGVDLRVYVYRHGVKEIVVVKDYSGSGDLVFDFELFSDHKVTGKNGEWDKKTKLDFKNSTLKVGESYFRNASVWDAAKNSSPVDIELYSKGNKIYLRKTIKQEFLRAAVFPVYTDHATTFFIGAGDGFIQYTRLTVQSDIWDIAHDATAGQTTAGGDGTFPTLGFFRPGTSVEFLPARYYTIIRAFIPIDTSAIGDTDLVTLTTLNLYCESPKEDDDNDGNDFITIVGTSQASTSTLVTGDYDQCGAIDNPTELAARIDIGSITTNAYNQFTLNPLGLSAISKTGFTKFGLREGHDVLDDSITGSSGLIYNRVIFSSSEATGTNQDPYLDITSSSPGTHPMIFHTRTTSEPFVFNSLTNAAPIIFDTRT